jgi:hypothetical protein
MKTIPSWQRNLIILGIIVICGIFLNIYFGSFFWQFTGSLLMAIEAEAIALLCANIGVFVYTHIKFAHDYLDIKTDSKPSAIVLGNIYLGSHLLIGLVLLGVYIVNFAPKAIN